MCTAQGCQSGRKSPGLHKRSAEGLGTPRLAGAAFSPDGKVVGQTSTSGCKFSGLATQHIALYMASLDVSVKGCTDERFNVRYSGHLMVSASAKEAKLSLVGLSRKPAAALTVKLQQASIDAVLKR